MSAHSSEEQFLNWYNEFADAIFRHCFFRLSDRERAKDATQETFIRLWNYLAQGKEVAHVRPLLYTIANNIIIDEYRRKETLSLDQMRDEQGFDIGFDARKGIEEKHDVERLQDMLKQIPTQYREAFTMRHIDGLSVKEIAHITGDSENIISVRIHRAIEKIKHTYAQRT